MCFLQTNYVIIFKNLFEVIELIVLQGMHITTCYFSPKPIESSGVIITSVGIAIHGLEKDNLPRAALSGLFFKEKSKTFLQDFVFSEKCEIKACYQTQEAKRKYPRGQIQVIS